MVLRGGRLGFSAARLVNKAAARNLQSVYVSGLLVVAGHWDGRRSRCKLWVREFERGDNRAPIEFNRMTSQSPASRSLVPHLVLVYP